MDELENGAPFVHLPASTIRQSRLEPPVRGDGGLVGQHKARALVGRPARDGGQVYPAHRGDDRDAGAPSVPAPNATDAIMVHDPFLG